MLIDVLTAALNAARKNRDGFSTLTLSTIVGDLKSNAVVVNGQKVVEDDKVVAYLKKFIKGIDETLSVRDSEDLRRQREIVVDFLPTQLTEQQLVDLVTGNLSLAEYMKFLKDNYAGLYDGKLAASVWKGVYG